MRIKPNSPAFPWLYITKSWADYQLYYKIVLDKEEKGLYILHRIFKFSVTIMKAIGYARASTTDQKDSIESQTKAIRDFFELQGYKSNEYIIFTEQRTGRDPQTSSELAKCIDTCIKHNVNLVVHALDRVGRKASFLLKLFELFKLSNIYIYSLTEGLQNHFFSFGMLSIYAEAETIKRAERQAIQKQLSVLKPLAERKKCGRSKYVMSADQKRKIAKSVSNSNRFVPSKEMLELTRAVITSVDENTKKGDVIKLLMIAYNRSGYRRKGDIIGRDLTVKIYNKVKNMIDEGKDA